MKDIISIILSDIPEARSYCPNYFTCKKTKGVYTFQDCKDKEKAEENPGYCSLAASCKKEREFFS